MLPPELTRARKREGKLTLSALSAAERARAVELSEALLAVARAGLGEARDDIEAGWGAVPAAPKERKLLLGLTHLLEGRAEFSAPTSAEPERVRRCVFELAARRRAALEEGVHLDRNQVLQEAGAELGLLPEQVEQALYADLRSAQRLTGGSLPSAAALVSEYELVQVQSVLLRAERIEAEVRAPRADAYRELFRKLKFRQLLCSIQPLSPSGYRLEIDGPMSLFGPTTKYGLELALSLPALLSCGELKLRAALRWGKRRERLSFEQSYAGPSASEGQTGLRSEVLELLQALGAARSTWQARPSEELLDLSERGGGVLVPDIELQRGTQRVLVEILGFWSRDAVFKRIEAAERGLKSRVLFVVSSRLRVSEELLDGAEAASLYVYKGKINPQALLRKVDELVGS